METISNVASNAATTASKLIWGEGNTESGQEPVSGQQGSGTKTEPFDQGNKEENAPTSTESQTAAPSAAVGQSGGQEPGTGTDVTEPQTPVQKQQGADKPTDEPTGVQQDAVKESKDEGEAAMAKRDPNDHSGEPMKMHDGSEKKEESSGGGGDADKSMEDKAKAEGTGEKYVKSTGMAADGGDFDATKPGAGREADRLLEEKGVDRSGDNKGPPQEAASSGGADESKSKPKMLEKVKEKLHIGKK